MAEEKEKQAKQCAAKVCRANGFKPGMYLRLIVTRLQSIDSEYVNVPEEMIVRLTAIGESAILTRRKYAGEYANDHCISAERVKNYAGDPINQGKA